jgi:hypothetical protein
MSQCISRDASSVRVSFEAHKYAEYMVLMAKQEENVSAGPTSEAEVRQETRSAAPEMCNRG